jgi:transcriptional regulator with XRE-family HTH domain
MALAEVRDPVSLDEIVETVNREHQLAVQAGMSMVNHALAAGDALARAKAMIPNGEWEQWLRASFPEKTPKQLRLYMRLAKYRDRVEAANPPTLSAAQRLLAGEAIKPPDDEMKAEARRLRQQEDLSYAAIAARLGVTATTVNGWLNPRVAERRRKRLNQESRTARRALHREQRANAARSADGAIAETYALLRRTTQAAEAAAGEEGDREAKAVLALAQQRLYAAEDLISKAVRLHKVPDVEA